MGLWEAAERVRGLTMLDLGVGTGVCPRGWPPGAAGGQDAASGACQGMDPFQGGELIVTPLPPWAQGDLPLPLGGMVCDMGDVESSLGSSSSFTGSNLLARLGMERSGHLEHRFPMWVPWHPGGTGCRRGIRMAKRNAGLDAFQHAHFPWGLAD